MEKTFDFKDVIQRIGYTVIDGIKVVQYTCILPLDEPSAMRLSITKLDAEMYKTHRDTCREDYAAFEDAAYLLQDEYLNK